jgi:hypothetical protein
VKEDEISRAHSVFKEDIAWVSYYSVNCGKMECKEYRIYADLLYVIHQTHGIERVGAPPPPPNNIQKAESGGTSDVE